MVEIIARAGPGTPADWLVRAKHDRCLADGEGIKLWDATTNGAPLREISFTISGREKQKVREVRQQLWAWPVLIGD